MALANCPRCNKAFNKLGQSPVCPTCRQREDEDFEIAYKYLRDHPAQTVKEISDGTGVDEELILDWYRTGRIIAGEAGYPCERCSTPIHRGKYCDKCGGGLKAELDDTRKGNPFQQGPDQGGGGGPRRDFSHQLRIDRR